MSYSFAPNNQPLYVSEGDYIQFKFKAPPSWNFTQTIQINIGALTQFWYITTIPEDFTPDPYPFAPVNEADLNTLYTYGDGSRAGETITVITGLTDTTQAPINLTSNTFGDESVFSCRIDYNGDGTWDTGWIQTSGSQTVENNARIQIRGTTSPFNTDVLLLNLSVGTSNETWTITNKAIPLNEPVPFPVFTDLDPVAISKYAYSEVIRIQGLTTAGPIALSNNGEWALSSNNNTSTDALGYEVLDNVTFSSSNGTVQNGDYLQIRIFSSSAGFTESNTGVSIGDISNGSTWKITTGENISTTPNSFSFIDVPNVAADALIGSDAKPIGGITGLGNNISVPVVVEDTTSSLVRVKVNNSSIGVFPTQVSNGDILTVYLQSSATFGNLETLTIKVGDLVIPTWSVVTNSGPDTDASFIPPSNKFNQPTSSFVSSTPIAVGGINQPITIESTGGYDALISIDFDTPVQGPRVFDPAINSSFFIVVFTSDQLSTPETTTITVGTGSTSNPFTWTAQTYAVVPPPATNLGKWYSNKTEKFDGYPIGTVLPILKEGTTATYGNTTGALGSRYAGFIACEGQSVPASQYWALFDMIGNAYGGDGVKNVDPITNVSSYSGDFQLPDYRNRRLCGVGLVDSSRGNSAFLPVSTVGKGITDVGAEGGYWYFDKVDSFGVQPLEQIQGPSTSTTGLNSQFFSLGTVRLTGLEQLTEDIDFTISGVVTAQVGPMLETTVSVPQHSHAYISAVTENDSGDPLIPWGPDGLQGRGMFWTNAEHLDTISTRSINDGDPPGENIRAGWASWLGTLGGFVPEMRKYYGSTFDLEDWISANLPYGYPVNEDTSGSSTAFGPVGADEQREVDFLTWWYTPLSGLPNGGATNGGNPGSTPFKATGGAENAVRACGGIADTNPNTFRVSPYAPTGGQTNTHSHLLTEAPVGDPNTDFTGGNSPGTGTSGPPFGSGLGAGVAGSLQTFQLWERRTINTPLPEGQWTNRSINEWAYRLTNGNGYWTSPDDNVTIDCPMLGGTGNGMILNITYTPYPSVSGGNPVGDTRYRVNTIVSAGQNYSVGDELSCQFWNDFPGSGNKMFKITAVSPAGTGGAGEAISVAFTQSELFLEMSTATFQFSSNFKKPFPVVTMQPQRQVPIINPFHKTKYVIKAY